MLRAMKVNTPADMAMFFLSPQAAEYNRILTYCERLSRAYHRTLRTLERLRAERRKEEIHAERMAQAEAKRQAAEAKQRTTEWLESFLAPAAKPEPQPASEPVPAPETGFVLPHSHSGFAAVPAGAYQRPAEWAA
jgi:hypothetical protein